MAATTAPTDDAEFASFGLRLHAIPIPPWQRIAGGMSNMAARWERREAKVAAGRPPSLYIALERRKGRTLDAFAAEIAREVDGEVDRAAPAAPPNMRAVRIVPAPQASRFNEQIIVAHGDFFFAFAAAADHREQIPRAELNALFASAEFIEFTSPASVDTLLRTVVRLGETNINVGLIATLRPLTERKTPNDNPQAFGAFNLRDGGRVDVQITLAAFQRQPGGIEAVADDLARKTAVSWSKLPGAGTRMLSTRYTAGDDATASPQRYRHVALIGLSDGTVVELAMVFATPHEEDKRRYEALAIEMIKSVEAVDR